MSEQRPAGPARFPRAYNPDPLPLHTRTPRQAATQGSATRRSPPLSRTKDAAHRTDPHERTNPTPTSRPLLLGFQTSPPARSANGSPGPRAHQSEAVLRPDGRGLSARGGARAAPGGLCAKLRPASRWPGGEDGGGDGQWVRGAWGEAAGNRWAGGRGTLEVHRHGAGAGRDGGAAWGGLRGEAGLTVGVGVVDWRGRGQGAAWAGLGSEGLRPWRAVGCRGAELPVVPAEHKLLSAGPTEPWSIREKLCLASSVMRSGDQNW